MPRKRANIPPEKRAARRDAEIVKAWNRLRNLMKERDSGFEYGDPSVCIGCPVKTACLETDVLCPADWTTVYLPSDPKPQKQEKEGNRK